MGRASYLLTVKYDTKTELPVLIRYTPYDILIRLGEYDFTISNETRALDFAVTEIRIHRDFDSASYVNDIAIVKIQRPTIFNSYIWPICLPPIGQTFEKKTAIVTGWEVSLTRSIYDRFILDNVYVNNPRYLFLS